MVYWGYRRGSDRGGLGGGGDLSGDDSGFIFRLSLVHVGLWCLPKGEFHDLPRKNRARTQAKVLLVKSVKVKTNKVIGICAHGGGRG